MAAEIESRAALQKRWIDHLEPQVDLPAWLLARGFQLAPGNTDPTRIALTNSSLEVFHLRKDPDRGSWTYANTSNLSDRGTIVDFMLRHDGTTLAACVDRLAGCVTRNQLSPEGITYQQTLRQHTNTLDRLETSHIAAVKAERSALRQLEHLGVDCSRYDQWRFGPVRSDQDVAALLTDPASLAHSRYRPTDRQVVLVERPIDALAYERTHGHQQACYIYTGDNPSGDNKRKIAHLLADLPEGMKVVVALGRDRRGDELASQLTKLAPSLQMERQKPQLGARWADQMQMEHRHRRSLQRLGGQLER
jgi:hypothetical protein